VHLSWAHVCRERLRDGKGSVLPDHLGDPAGIQLMHKIVSLTLFSEILQRLSIVLSHVLCTGSLTAPQPNPNHSVSVSHHLDETQALRASNGPTCSCSNFRLPPRLPFSADCRKILAAYRGNPRPTFVIAPHPPPETRRPPPGDQTPARGSCKATL
jgi:hypothetical protein